MAEATTFQGRAGQVQVTMQDEAPVKRKEASKSSHPDGGDQCRFCLSRQFKRSRLHTGDVFTLLRGRVPARCARCGQLQTISFKTAKTALPVGSHNDTAAPLPASMTPAALRDSGMRQAAEVQVESRSAIPASVLEDALDIRCQYCPGQAFRRSRLRAQDLMLIAVMRYSVRCLRCGQRQTVNFMVAGGSVPSHVKQARALRNTDTWKEFTSTSTPELRAVDRVAPRAPVVGHVYALKDETPDYLLPMAAAPEPRVKEPSVKEREPEPVKAAAPRVKRPVDDQSIW